MMPNHCDELREAAMAVVLTWDTEGTQHNTMPALRKALGLPPERPTLEEARRRLNAYIGIESHSSSQASSRASSRRNFYEC